MSSERPNVLLVQADQWRGQALGCVGNEQMNTSNIDALSEEGVLFERTFSPCPVCSPARGSIQTGCYPHRHRVIGNTFLDVPLSDDVETIAESLRSVGYDTGYVGKWHLDGAANSPSYVPTSRRRGYEFWSGFDRDGHQHFRGHPIFASPSIPKWIGDRQPDVQTEIALDFLDQSHDTPFFLYLSWGPPHHPYNAPEEYREQYDEEALDLRPNVPEEDESETRENLASYYAMCTWLDDNLGRLLSELEHRGLADDTLVVFTSDHGDFVGSHGRYGKRAPQDESSRVPLLIRYPGEVNAGIRSSAIVNLIDLAPTLLSLCDAPIPDTMQGRDLSSLPFENTERKPGHTYMEGFATHRSQFDSPWRAIRTDQYLYTVDLDLETIHLFDVEEDPYQLHNLANTADPDIPMTKLRRLLVESVYSFDDRKMKSLSTFDFENEERVFDFGSEEIRHE